MVIVRTEGQTLPEHIICIEMGSIEAACISGFLCRLCSEMHRTVIHIYGDQGQKHELAKKINEYLPVTIAPNDPLPKTICETCMNRVEQHHELMVKMEKHRTFFAAQSTRAQLIRSGEARNSTASTNRTETITNRQTRTVTPTVTVTNSGVTTPTTVTDRISPNRNIVDGNSTTTNDIHEREHVDDESATADDLTDTCERDSNSNNNNNRHATLADNLRQDL